MMASMASITTTVHIVVEHCCACGIPFGITAALQGRRRDDGGWFYCPNGHSQRYTETTVMRLEREKRAIERGLANRDEDLRAERASHSATKGQVTRLRKRVANGVCPCCHRTFAQLSRHMASQHPEFSERLP